MSFLDFSFKHPTSIQISRLTQCGKTRLVLRILEHQVIQPFPTRIIWVYCEPQPDYNEAANCTRTLSLSTGGGMIFTIGLHQIQQTC